jgi:ribonuclease HI
LLHGLRLAISLGIKRLLVYGDSLLVVQQVNKEWDCNKETMDAYVQEVRKLENKFFGLEVHHMIREHNVGADILSKLGSPCISSSGSFHPGAEAAIHQVLTSDNH